MACDECGDAGKLYEAEDGASYCHPCYSAWYGHAPQAEEPGSDLSAPTDPATGSSVRPGTLHQEPLPCGMRVIPLGAWCTANGMGMVGERMPFDSLRTSVEGILHHLRTDSRDLLTYDYVLERRNQDHYDPHRFPNSLSFERIFVAWWHSHWHHDLRDPVEMEKYRRRIERLQNLRVADLAALRAAGGEGESSDSETGPLIFVRSANSTYELAAAGELHALLVELFGPRAFLLYMVNHQPSHKPVFFEDRPTLLLHLLGKHRSGEGLKGSQRLYAEAVGLAFRYARGSGRPPDHESFPSLREFLLSERGAAHLAEDVFLGVDLTRQFTPHPGVHELPLGSVLGCGPFALLDAVARVRAGDDVRRSSYDGCLYLFEGLAASCEGYATDINAFWRDECVPLGADAPLGTPVGPGTKAAALAEQASTMPTLPTGIPPAGEVRRSTYDGQLYDFYGFLRVCGVSKQYTREEVEAFWEEGCTPIGPNGEGLRDPAMDEPVGELRRNPHDGHVYNFKGLLRVCQEAPKPVRQQWPQLPGRGDNMRR